MKIKVLKSFNHDEMGQLNKGDELEVTAAQAASLAYFPFVEFVGGKKIETKPEPAAQIETKPEPKAATKIKGR